MRRSPAEEGHVIEEDGEDGQTAKPIEGAETIGRHGVLCQLSAID
jgi:hypothetical protein